MRNVVRAVVVVGMLWSAGSVEAQDRAVQARLVQYGRMSRNDARDLTRTVSARLAENARRGGNDYDRIRQAASAVLFTGANAGPGNTPEEYQRRLTEVLDRLGRGLDEALLTAIFAPGPNAAALCAADFSVTMNACDALLAAAAREPALVPYAPPDDGRALRAALEGSGATRAQAQATVDALRSVMIGLPGNMTNDAFGRGLLALLEACPGGLSERESQLRAWHIGPTEGMVQCVVQAVVGNRPPQTGVNLVATQLRLAPDAAMALVRWAMPGSAMSLAQAPPPAPVAPVAAPITPEFVASQAQQAEQAGRWVDAARAWLQVVTMDPSRGPAWASLGAARLRTGDGPGAAQAYEQAAQRLPRTAPPTLAATIFAGLGQGYERAGDFTRATAAYRQSLAADARNVDAQAGLGRLGASAAPAQPTASAWGPPAQARQPQGWGPPSAQPAATPTPSGWGAPPPPPSPAQEAERWRGQGLQHVQNRRFDLASSAFQRAVELEPGNPLNQTSLGAALLATNDLPGALVAYLEAVRLQPNDAGTLASLGRVYFQLGDPRQARMAFDRALAIDGNNPVAREGVARLSAAPPGPGTAPVGPGPVGPVGPVAPTAPPVPEVPSREAILQAMRPLIPAVRGCVPGRTGVVRFSVTVEGSSGTVTETRMTGGDVMDVAGTAEADCLVGVVRGATFQRFTRPSLTIEYPFQLQ